MKKRDIIRSIAKETFEFPILFLPLFLFSLLTITLVSDAFIAAFGQQASLWLNLLALLLVSPAAIGITILMDRKLQKTNEPNPGKCWKSVSARYSVLVGANFVSWVAVLIGLLVFVLPGLYLLVKLLFINQEVLLHDKTSLEDVLRNSWSLTSGHWVELFTLVASLTIPILLLELFSYQFPPSLSATIQATVGTILQTWLVLATTRAFLWLAKAEESAGEEEISP